MSLSVFQQSLSRGSRGSDYSAVDKTFQSRITELNADISRMRPNMKAVKQFDDVVSRYNETNKSLEQSRHGAKAAELAFLKLKAQRSKRFNDTFTHIKKQ